MNIILIHGFGEDHFVWKEFMSLLPKKHTYYTPDYATFTDVETIDDYVKWLKEFLRERDVERCVLIGHSMGGYIALAFAEKYQEMVLGLGLFHSSAYADNTERKAGRLKTIDFIQKHGSEEFIKDFYPKMFADDFKKKNKELIERHIERYRVLSKRSLKNAQLAMRNRKDTTQVLKQANYPVMIIAGEEDKFVAVEAAREQIKLLKKGYTDVLSGVAHAGMFERPNECARMVETFIAACSHVVV
ncbi:alpha/beta fold hydrolase [Emticicia sp. BO119]|uniref:alpha/beta fold hydrolase n=1 Tax=Emticicia sp. BO119 TaxID=2757768 RepID=UPI0015F0DE06|nr:alpha/beta hydrolase [Emticicia sp. BO119]MBA4851231.1 alpha/beta hydrolase [Emticicia sp. BO119]